MKRNLYLILSLLVIPFLTYSQSRDYFKNNILELDPIEGIYDADIFKQGANAFQTFPETYETSTKLTITRIGENKFSISGGRPNDYIERVGETNVYNYWNYWDAAGWVRTRFYLLNSGRSFEWRFEVPDTQLKSDLGRNYQYGIRVMFRYNCVKEYPTTSMYLEAEEEAIRIEQERQRQQEIEAAKQTEWSGSGFALNNGYFVTNYHVVEDANSITIKGVKGDFNTAFDAEIVATDKYNDLALLKINDSRFTGFGSIPYKLKTNTSDVGEEVFVLGYPLTSTMGDEIKLTTGVISSKTGFQGDVSLYQISAPVQPGNSGGPLFDSKGNLIGIVSSKHIGAENVGYAIKTSYLMNLVESAVSSSIIPGNNSISGLPLTEKVKSVKDFVFFIECSKD